jgi:hypothetical protein
VNFPADEKINFAMHHECVLLGNRIRAFANSGQALLEARDMKGILTVIFNKYCKSYFNKFTVRPASGNAHNRVTTPSESGE